MVEVKLGYGKGYLKAVIPEENLIGILEKKKDGEIIEEDVINHALDNPIGGQRLEDIVKKGEKICIVFSDITRAWQRMNVYLPFVVERLLKAGVKEEDIVFLCATGSHRRHTAEEHKLLLGEELYSRFRVVDHDSRDEGNMVYLGATSFGTPVKINKIALESDHIVITGAVVYHDLAGWAGGKKSIIPGIAAYETIMANHALSLNPGIGSGIHPGVRSGNILNNPIHEDMEEAAKMVNPSFMFNVIIGEDGKICDAVSGDFLKAHEVARARVEERSAIKINKKCQLAIVSCGGYPKDIDFYQGTKALINAKEAVAEGGTIILVGEYIEGFGHKDLERIILDYDNIQDREEEVRRDYTIPKFIGYLTEIIANKYRVIAVSSLDKEVLRRINIEGADSLDEALELAYKRYGNNVSTYVIPSGSDILPII